VLFLFKNIFAFFFFNFIKKYKGYNISLYAAQPRAERSSNSLPSATEKCQLNTQQLLRVQLVRSATER
jgi:hypothetical protein